MAGRRKKPCEFCEEDNWYSKEGTGAHQLAIEFYFGNNLLGITSFADGADGETEELQEDIELNYCPVCGRKLEGI